MTMLTRGREFRVHNGWEVVYMSKVESLECPNCGGKLVSAHKARFFICQHCGTKHHLKGIPTDDVVPRLHGTISVGILGGAAIPLMARGTVLPAEVVQSYSTANDNQMNIDVTLVFGENHLTIDNIQIGTFSFGNIAPAPQGVPKIDIRV